MRQSFFDYCKQYHKDALLREWDTAHNLPLTPQTVTYGSHKSAWWRCENGHEWKAAVYTRSAGTRCPYCTGRKVMVGFNDLATQSPELARQWDYRKNAPLVPADISAGSHRSVWWRCEKGHSWRASIHSRASGCGCPICAGRQILVGENDLATVDPELAQEWNAARNTRKPTEISRLSQYPVWSANMGTTGRLRSPRERTAGTAAHIVLENWFCPASTTLRHKIRCLLRSGTRNETKCSHRSRSR